MECSDICVLADTQSDGAPLAIATKPNRRAKPSLIEQWRKKVPSAAAPDAATAFWEGGQSAKQFAARHHRMENRPRPGGFLPVRRLQFFGGRQYDRDARRRRSAIRLRKMVTELSGAGRTV